MEEITNKKGVPAAAVVGITILAAIIFGAGAYMYANNQATGEKDTLNAQIVTLQKGLADAKKTDAAVNPSKETTTTPSKIEDTTAKASIPGGWMTHESSEYGFKISYPSTMSLMSLDADNDRAYVYNIRIGDTAVRVLKSSNLSDCKEPTVAEQVKCFYVALEQNSDHITQQKIGNNTFVYADFVNLDTNARNLWVFTGKGDYIYEFDLGLENPNATEETLFKNILSTFQFTK